MAVLLTFFMGWYGCEQSEIMNELPEVFEHVDGVSVNPGRYRVQLLIDENNDINSYEVKYWPGYLTDKAKSMTVQSVNDSPTDILLEDLEEDLYTFEIYAINKSGEKNNLGKATGRSYGEAYEKKLTNRKPLLVDFESLTTGKTVWSDVPTGFVYGEIDYESASGGVSKKLYANQNEIRIENFAGENILYRSLFIPTEAAIDTFVALYDTILIIPRLPVEPYPLEGTSAQIQPELIWKNSIETAEGILYLGEDSLNMSIVDTLTIGYYQLHELKQNTQYFWRVDPKSEVGFSQKGDVWSFTTELVEPVKVSFPHAGAERLNLLSVLEWEVNENAKGYNLYLGTSENKLDLIGENLTNTKSIPGALLSNQKYYMRVDAIGGDLPENITPGEVISFNTGEGAFVNFRRSDKTDFEGAFNYIASHEVAATFTEQTFPMFGTDVKFLPHWTDDASATCMQMIFRTYHNFPDLFVPRLFSDWIGTDTRSIGDPFTLVIKGLPQGEYEWRSWHVDVSNQTGAFDLTLSDASGEKVVAEAFDIQDTGADLKEDRNFDKVIPLNTTVVSNGVDDVTLTFSVVFPYGTLVIHRFFVMNGFELMKK